MAVSYSRPISVITDAAGAVTQRLSYDLVSNGYNVIRRTVGSNGPVTVLSNGQNTYSIYTATSTGASSAQVVNAAGNIVIKYRFTGP